LSDVLDLPPYIVVYHKLIKKWCPIKMVNYNIIIKSYSYQDITGLSLITKY